MARFALALVLFVVLSTAHAQFTASVPSNGRPVAVTGLSPGATYQLRVRGSMTFGRWVQNGRVLRNDACYEWAAKGYPDPLPVLANSFGVNVCADYQPSHSYESAPFVAPAASMEFQIVDSDYRDNAGALFVEVVPVGAGPAAARYCVLRDQDLYGPPICFQFYLADTRRTSGAMATIQGGTCAATPLAVRQGYEVDPNLGGPYRTWEAADGAMSRLSRYGDDFYGCIAALTGGDDGNGAGTNTCRWAFDGECDEPGIGTGLCDPGTDTADCSLVGADPSNTCRWAFDGECDEPGIGTGYCDAGTDTADCAGVGQGQEQQAQPEPELVPVPEQVEERRHQLTACIDWSVANSGGVEGTVDHWDISTIPDGAYFDLKFDAVNQPDVFRVAYQGRTVHDTGWRGDSSYEGNPNFPGGIAGPGQGEQHDLFAKTGMDTFTVTVIGGEPDTLWSYNVRCRTR